MGKIKAHVNLCLKFQFSQTQIFKGSKRPFCFNYHKCLCSLAQGMTKSHEKGWSWKSPALCLVLMPCWCPSAPACFHIPATGQASFPKEQLLSGVDGQCCLSSGIQPTATKESSSRYREAGTVSLWQC